MEIPKKEGVIRVTLESLLILVTLLLMPVIGAASEANLKVPYLSHEQNNLPVYGIVICILGILSSFYQFNVPSSIYKTFKTYFVQQSKLLYINSKQKRDFSDDFHISLLIILHIILDSIILSILLINFYCLGKFTSLLGYKNPFVTTIIDSYVHPIILLTVCTSSITQLILHLLRHNIKIIREGSDEKEDDSDKHKKPE